MRALCEGSGAVHTERYNSASFIDNSYDQTYNVIKMNTFIFGEEINEN